MIETYKGPTQLILEAFVIDFEGLPKTNLTAATVRVFHLDSGGNQVNDLVETALVRVGTTSTWRYIWKSPGLTTAGSLVVEYKLTDPDQTVIFSEDLRVYDVNDEASPSSVNARLTTLEGKTDTLLTDSGKVLDAHLGRQKLDIQTKTLTLYKRDGVSLQVFDCFDDTGNPSAHDVFDRRPKV